MTTYREGGGQDGESCWRFQRFAQWLILEQNQTPIKPRAKPHVAPPKTATETDSSSASWILVPADKHEISDDEEAMASETEDKIAQLEAQLRDLRRTKKDRRAQ